MGHASEMEQGGEALSSGGTGKLGSTAPGWDFEAEKQRKGY